MISINGEILIFLIMDAAILCTIFLCWLSLEVLAGLQNAYFQYKTQYSEYLQAAKSISSRTRIAPEMINPKPKPGNM